MNLDRCSTEMTGQPVMAQWIMSDPIQKKLGQAGVF